MSRLLSTVLLAAICASGALAQEKKVAVPANAEANPSSARASLRGVWKVTELSSREIGGEWKPLAVSRSLYLFTDKHYSYMFTPGAGPRRLHAGDPNKPTDAEKVAAYDSFVAASGTYVLTGTNLVLTATLHKNPNEMVGHSLTYAIELNGDVLKMTIANPPFSPGHERRTVLTRVE